MSFPPCTLQQISQHIYWFTPEQRTDRPSLAVVVGEKMTLMLDIGASPKHTTEFLEALKQAGIAAPGLAIASHWHWDHWFGIEALNFPVLAHRETAENMRRQVGYDFSDKGLAEQVAQGVEIAFCTEHMEIEMSEDERKNLRLRLPDIVFEGRLDFDLGGIHCQVEHVGGDHASDSCVMFIPEDGVLFMGDCFYYNIYTEPHYFSREKLVPLIAKLDSYEAKLYIEGHSSEILEQVKIKQWFEWIRLCYEFIDKYGPDEAKLEAALRQVTQDEDALDFLRDILAGEKIADKER
jgi:glyoxylase-like metal-dependent hydrolase (beta-lactamase superfamily II)